MSSFRKRNGEQSMKLRIILAAGAALALTACGGGSETTENTAANTAEADANAVEAAPADNAADAAANNSAEATNVADAATPAATPAAGAAPTKEFIVGKWGDNGDCTLAIDFRADGTTDGPFGDWDYKDGAL